MVAALEVGAQLQAGDTISLFIAGGEHDDRDR